MGVVCSVPSVRACLRVSVCLGVAGPLACPVQVCSFCVHKQANKYAHTRPVQKTTCYTSSTYIYTQVLLHALMAQPNGANLKRLSQMVANYAKSKYVETGTTFFGKIGFVLLSLVPAQRGSAQLHEGAPCLIPGFSIACFARVHEDDLEGLI